MELIKRNKLILLFYLINGGLLIFWGLFLFWLIKMELLWNPLQFFAYVIPLLFLAYIPAVYFLRSVAKIAKNLKERINVSKRYIAASLFICSLVWSLSIIMFILYFFPSALFYDYDDGPYLIWNDDPETTITIVWTTNNPAGTDLEYGETLGNLKTCRNDFLTQIHVVELKDLKPGTKYYYQISEFSSKLYSFTTAPSGVAPFEFVAISDTHAGSTSSRYGSIINEMSSHEYDFIISAGDIAKGEGEDLEGWHNFFDLMERHASNRPYMVAIGNHEYGVDFFAKNFKYFFPYGYVESWGHYYSFDYSNAHFIMLDVFQNQLDWGGFLSETQELWLRRDLAANQDKWLFVVLHAPLYSTGDFNMNQKLIAQLAPIFYENEVDVVLSGHDHHYEAFWTNRTEDWGGTYYFVTGGGGGGLDTSIMDRENNPWKRDYHRASVYPYQHDYITLHDQIYGELTHHFMHFEVSGSSLHVQAIRADGTLIQEFNIRK